MKTVVAPMLLALGGAGIFALMFPGRSSAPTAQAVQVVTGRVSRAIARQASTRGPSAQPTAPAINFAEAHNITSSKLQAARGKIFNEPTVDIERRDNAWADPSEVTIRHALEKIPNVNLGTISVICGSSVCRANASLKDSIPESEKSRSRDMIVDEKFFTPDPYINLFPKRSIANSGPNDAFTIEFSRIHM